MQSILVWSLFFLLICSCQEEEIETPWECLPCGSYYGSFSGNVRIPLTSLDTSFTNTSTIIEITEGLNERVNLSFDFSGFFGSPPGTLLINFNQSSWADSTISGQAVAYSGQLDTSLDLDAANSYNYQVLLGTLVLSGEATGVLTFEAIR